MRCDLPCITRKGSSLLAQTKKIMTSVVVVGAHVSDERGYRLPLSAIAEWLHVVSWYQVTSIVIDGKKFSTDYWDFLSWKKPGTVWLQIRVSRRVENYRREITSCIWSAHVILSAILDRLQEKANKIIQIKRNNQFCGISTAVREFADFDLG